MVEKRKKRKYTRREGVKALPNPPANKAILEPVTKKSRQCDYCLRFSDSVYCPNCGKVTSINRGN